MRLLTALAAIAIGTAACSSTSSSGGTTTDGGASTKPHRATGVACPQSRGPGMIDMTCASDGGITTTACDKDSDCTTSSNGRCYTNVGGIRCPGNVCSYDGCFADSDCANDLPCECRSPLAHDANFCVTGSNCRVDADCSAGGLCSPSGVSNCQMAYFCRTASDACGVDADCVGQSAGSTCSYDATAKRWQCGSATCLPVP